MSLMCVLLLLWLNLKLLHLLRLLRHMLGRMLALLFLVKLSILCIHSSSFGENPFGFWCHLRNLWCRCRNH